MSTNMGFGTGTTHHYYAQGDETRCPHCFQNKLEKIGILTLSNNTQQDTHKCTGCGKLSSVVGGGIGNLVTEAAQSINGSAGFISVTSGALNTAINNQAQQAQSGGWTLQGGPLNGYGSAGGMSGAGYGTAHSGPNLGLSLDYNTNSKFDMMNSNLSTISSTMYTLVQEMQKLSQTVKDLAQQNKDLMEKLATDPLNGIRKAVNSFDLE